ncbi:MAG: putative DNA-binding domain-containing protein [Planctomycetes bacterium]|nr:putative DNA-binding domain-containing protein [Planctomycetota bacterium]MBI3845022.1 putative DNA-binding domain-containing protein [Planctomycetota bacterium]
MSRRAKKGVSLDQLERWFQGEIVRPHVPGRRGNAKGKGRHVDRVLPSRTLTAAERIDIYSRMYFARLHDVLAEDYPSLVRILGWPAFTRFARAYLARHPSRHYSLNGLGRNAPRFLAGPVRVPRRALLVDLARLELAMTEVFDAEESTTLVPDDLRSIPPDRYAGARLRPIAAFRLLALEHRANAIVTAVRQEKPLPSLARERTWVAVYRRAFAVWRMDLTEPMFTMLSALSRGRSIEQSVRATARAWSGTPETLEREIRRWFGEWIAEGIFSAIVLDGERAPLKLARKRAARTQRHAISDRHARRHRGLAVSDPDVRSGVVSNAPRAKR